ncbi:hypothetical protein KKG48_03625 [Patescibacteria group bacterium]|nr:hypothetical protein [Patescibacteria group bacterium]MCG2694703.1 hypothetical protein [Candidatus Parcubacteria bacterium]
MKSLKKQNLLKILEKNILEDYQIEKLIKDREKKSNGKYLKLEDMCWN